MTRFARATTPGDRLLGAIAIAIAGATGCSGDPTGGYDVAVRVSARVPVLEGVEVMLARDPCSSPTLAAGGTPASVVARWRGERTSAMDEPPLGVVPEGHYGLFARGFDRACRIVAVGCGVADIEPDGRGELEVLLRRIEGASCALGRTCGAGGSCTGDALACGPDHVGPWRDTTALPEPRASASIVLHRGEIVVAGGGRAVGDASTDVLVATAGGAGGIGTWSMSSPLPVASASAAIASDGARIYLVGGISSGEASASVLVARDSSTREWSHATELPSARVDHGLVLSAGALYVVGGRDALGAEATSSVLRATLGADGAVEAWADERPLPDPRPVLAAFVHGGRLYAIAPDRVFVSIANEDGLGPWVRIEVPLPVGGEPGIAHAAEAVFVVGGEAPDGTPGTDVFAAELTEDGGLAPWRRVSALPEGRAGLGALAIDEEIAVVGGAIEGDAPPPSLLARHCVR